MIRKALLGTTALAIVTLLAPVNAFAALYFQFSTTGAAYNGGGVTVNTVHSGNHNTIAGVFPGKISTSLAGLGSTGSTAGGLPFGAFNTFCVDIPDPVQWGQQYQVNDPLTALSAGVLVDAAGAYNTGAYGVGLAIGYLYDTYGPGNSLFHWNGGGGSIVAPATTLADTWEAVQLAIWALLDSTLWTNLDGNATTGKIATYAGTNTILKTAHNMFVAAYAQGGNTLYGSDYQIVTNGIQEFLVPNGANPNVATPEPASFAVWAGFAGIGLVAMQRRRRLKRS